MMFTAENPQKLESLANPLLNYIDMFISLHLYCFGFLSGSADDHSPSATLPRVREKSRTRSARGVLLLGSVTAYRAWTDRW